MGETVPVFVFILFPLSFISFLVSVITVKYHTSVLYLLKYTKLFIFIIMLLFVFRLSFIVIMGDYLGESTILKDVMLSLYYGFKISLKSAGILAGTSFLICLLASIFVPKF